MAAMMGGAHHMNRPPSNSMGSRGAGQQPPPPQAQPPYKGTLPPGTKVAVGNVTVTVKRYLSEGGFAHVYLVTSDQPIPIPIASSGSVSASVSLPGSQARRTRPETLHVLKRMAVPDKDALATVRSEVEAHVSSKRAAGGLKDCLTDPRLSLSCSQRLLRNQPNVVHFIEASASSMPGGGYEIFILMEYCAGGGIIDLMNARLRDRLREPEVLKIFGDVCAGVSVMHHLDPPLMHRDIKIENILLSPAAPDQGPGAGPTYKLCDFGSAAPVLSRRAPKSLDEIKRLEADLNRATTLQYRAPEMVDVYQKRVIDEKADIWALGVLLYKLCYYTTPFEENGGGPLAILSANYRFPPMPVYSQNLKDLIGEWPLLLNIRLYFHNSHDGTAHPQDLHHSFDAARAIDRSADSGPADRARAPAARQQATSDRRAVRRAGRGGQADAADADARQQDAVFRWRRRSSARARLLALGLGRVQARLEPGSAAVEHGRHGDPRGGEGRAEKGAARQRRRADVRPRLALERRSGGERCAVPADGGCGRDGGSAAARRGGRAEGGCHADAERSADQRPDDASCRGVHADQTCDEAADGGAGRHVILSRPSKLGQQLCRESGDVCGERCPAGSFKQAFDLRVR